MEPRMCPNCYGINVYCCCTDMCRYDNYHVECEECDFTGPEYKEDKPRAIREWNEIPMI